MNHPRDHALAIWGHQLDWVRNARGDVQVILPHGPAPEAPAAATEYATPIQRLTDRFQAQMAQLGEWFAAEQIDVDEYSRLAEEYSADYQRQVEELTN